MPSLKISKKISRQPSFSMKRIENRDANLVARVSLVRRELRSAKIAKNCYSQNQTAGMKIGQALAPIQTLLANSSALPASLSAQENAGLKSCSQCHALCSTNCSARFNAHVRPPKTESIVSVAQPGVQKQIGQRAEQKVKPEGCPRATRSGSAESRLDDQAPKSVLSDEPQTDFFSARASLTLLLGLPDVHPKSRRKTLQCTPHGSRLTRLGESPADAFTIMKLAGHSSVTACQRN
jgi:hypothetical protein